MISPGETRRILGSWGTGPELAEVPHTVLDRFEEQVIKRPFDIAVRRPKPDPATMRVRPIGKTGSHTRN